MTKSCGTRIFDVDRYAYAALMYDFYAPLLTDKQREVIEMYFMQNLSLSEISEISGITRQAASILLNRTEKLLINYENRLKLAESYKYEKEKRDELEIILNDIINSPFVNDSIKDKLKEALNYL